MQTKSLFAVQHAARVAWLSAHWLADDGQDSEPKQEWEEPWGAIV